MIVADNIRITDPMIAAAIKRNDPEPIRRIAVQCEAAGADAMDLNPGPLTREPDKKMAFLVETVQEITDLPVLIDTPNPVAMEGGLRANRKKAVINAFTPEPERIQRILPLAKEYDSDIIGYCLYPNGHVPPDGPERLAMALELFSAIEKEGIDPTHLIIDPIIVPITWTDGAFHAMEVLSVIREVSNLLGFPVRTIAALSNLTSVKGPTKTKRLMEKTYLAMLMASGLSMAMLNVFNKEVMQTAAMCEAISKSGIFCWECFDDKSDPGKGR